jgi:hypothetical protein
LLAITNDQCRLQSPLGTGPALTLPLSVLSVLWLAAPEGADHPESFRRHLLAEKRRRDVILLRNGDRIEGTFATLDKGMVRIEAVGGHRTSIEKERVAVIALNAALTRAVRPRGTYGRLVLANGARLSLVSAHLDGQALVCKTLFGTMVRASMQEVRSLDVLQGCAIYLSDLKPHYYEHTPYLGVSWPYQPDGSVLGHPLVLGGSTFDKGLGMHSQSRISYELRGQYRWFETRVGLDGRTGRGGSVVIQVLVDGKPQDLGRGHELSGGAAPQQLRVPIKGARELTLVVLYGRRGDVQDHVDWADARLIKD